MKKKTEPMLSFSIGKQKREQKKAKAIFFDKPEKEKLLQLWQEDVGWQLLAMSLYLQGVSTAVIGNWLGVNKSTISRWLDSVVLLGKRYLSQLKIPSSSIFAIDEKWIKIGKHWWYLFAAVDHLTGCPSCRQQI